MSKRARVSTNDGATQTFEVLDVGQILVLRQDWEWSCYLTQAKTCGTRMYDHLSMETGNVINNDDAANFISGPRRSCGSHGGVLITRFSSCKLSSSLFWLRCVEGRLVVIILHRKSCDRMRNLTTATERLNIAGATTYVKSLDELPLIN